MMHGAFDVGMQNKRLTLFSMKCSPAHGCEPPAKPDKPLKSERCERPERPERPEWPERPERADKPPPCSKNGRPVLGSENGGTHSLYEAVLRSRHAPSMAALALYICLVASDYMGPARRHGSKLAAILVVCTPVVNLLLLVRGAPMPIMAAVTAAHVCVALDFMRDAGRFHRETVSPVIVCCLAAVFMLHASGTCPADMTRCCLFMCAGLYSGTCLALALLQGSAVLDTMTLLTLQQLFIIMTLLLVGLVRSPARC